MPTFRIPINLDLKPFPPRDVELSLPISLATVLAHTGGGLDWKSGGLSAQLPDGRTLPAQWSEDRIWLRLPADVAAGDQVRITLAIQEAPEPQTPRVVFSQGPDAVEIRVDGARFATYRYNTTDPELPRPYFHPIIGPTGIPITQDGEIPGTKQAHFHHTGLVLAHQNFSGGNNWQIGPQHSRMRHLAFDVMESGTVAGRMIQRLEWPNAAGDRVVFRERRTVSIPAREPVRRCIDVESTLTCGDQPATWNATPYHLLAVRVPDAMVVERGGVITNSEGATNERVAGEPAKWLDFSGPLNGACGVALFDHPGNFRHPTRWLNFENETVGAAPTYQEPHTWAAGESRTFRYRVYLHRGDVKEGRVAEEYAAWVATPGVHVHRPVRIA